MAHPPPPTVVPDLRERLVVVTGASDGIGLGLAARFAAAGAEVLLPVRDPAKGAAALDRIRGVVPGARVATRDLDLASLASVARLGAQLAEEGRPIHVLVNNAGVMNPPTRQVTADGLELQLGVNHVGHVALVAHLLPLLVAGGARVTTQSSVAVRGARMHWDDLQWEQRYRAGAAYGQSKLALTLFALELDRRSRAGGWGITSNVAHPGITATNLLAAQPGMGRAHDTRAVGAIRWLARRGVLAQTVEGGLQPALHAAVDPGAEGGRSYGPSGFLQQSGPPAEQAPFRPARDEAEAARVWDVSEELAGAALGV